MIGYITSPPARVRPPSSRCSTICPARFRNRPPRMTVLISVMSESLASVSAERSSGQHKVAKTSGRNMKLPSQASTAARGVAASSQLSVMDFAGKFKGRPRVVRQFGVFASSITSTDDAAACLPILSKSDVGHSAGFYHRRCQASPTGRGRNQEEFDMKSSFFALACLAVATIGAFGPGTATDVRRRSGRRALPRHAQCRAALDSHDRNIKRASKKFIGHKSPPSINRINRRI